MRSLLLGAAVGFAALAWTEPARAVEREWRVGTAFGWAVADFPTGAASGFGGGAHLSYGINDAVNVRVHLDLLSFPGGVVLGEADQLVAYDALVWNAAIGTEYVLDVLDWVPYVGVLAGPVDVLIERQPHDVQLGLEIPAGLGYQWNDFVFGAEGRYRLLMFGSELAPPSSFALFGRVEYLFGR